MLYLLQVLKTGFSNLDSIRILSMHVIKAGLRLLFVNRKSVTIDIRAATALLPQTDNAHTEPDYRNSIRCPAPSL